MRGTCLPQLQQLLTLLGLFALLHACPPEVCICKWKGGKQTVECGGQQLPNIPEGMDPGTQVLNFSGNALQVLQSERFLRMDLLNLQKIYLSRNQLIRVNEKAFRGLSNLVELDLSENSLQHVPSETFQDYSSLMRLSLSGNPIRELKTSAFRHLSFLTTLELSNCQIERIENEAFVGMDNLEWLRLDGNRIGFIQGAHILPKSLHGISLQANRWTCDCRLLDVHGWLVNYNTPQTEEPKCMEPARLKGQAIKALKKDELACLPEVSPQSSYSEVSEGRNMSITCVVRAIPEPKVLWLFNGQVMTNDSFLDNLHMYYYIDESGSNGAEEKRSEIFIYNVGAEDNGTFSCVGQNIAGTTFSNYTLRVIIKEPPVVNEVSFPRDYMNYIIASSTGGAIIFVVLLCTIVIKCKRSEPAKRKKCAGPGGAVTSIAGGTNSTACSSSEAGMMKCASILTDGDSLSGGAGLLLGDNLTPTKLCKENGGAGATGGGVILGGQMKQNLLLYAPSSAAQQQLADTLQLNVSLGGANGPHAVATPSTPQQLLVSNGLAYCSPPTSVRNYQEKNPDLVNDAAESVKHKLKTTISLDGDYDAASDCSGPCSIQSSISNTPVQYDNCYQLSAVTPQFGLRAAGLSSQATSVSRFAGLTTLPRGIQLKNVMSSLPPQHQVDVHLNPVCFLGQDGFAYDYSSAHLAAAAAAASATTHQQLQLQQSLPPTASQQQQQQQQHQQLHHQQQQQQHPLQQQQQNFYRTLPHNRAHKQQQFAAAAAQNPSMRYSLEAEFVQRASTPTGYDKYNLPNVRFTAEGYPQALPMQQQQQFPSPPEGYKSSDNAPAAAAAPQSQAAIGFQQWPSCLPGYHAQPVHYPAAAILGVLPAAMTQAAGAATAQQQAAAAAAAGVGATSSQPTSNLANVTNQTQSAAPTLSKRCVGIAQADNSTIPECDESDISPTTSHMGVAAAAAAAAALHEPTTGNAAGAGAAAASAATNNNNSNNNTTNSSSNSNNNNSTNNGNEDTSKLKHLNGPLADSPDEGYVGEAQETSDI